VSAAARLQLKRPTGWFAAGQEVQRAATSLSDASFKVFVWLCLHAERASGRLRVTAGTLAWHRHCAKVKPKLCGVSKSLSKLESVNGSKMAASRFRIGSGPMSVPPRTPAMPQPIYM
jgi:hypothetical protein